MLLRADKKFFLAGIRGPRGDLLAFEAFDNVQKDQAWSGHHTVQQRYKGGALSVRKITTKTLTNNQSVTVPKVTRLVPSTGSFCVDLLQERRLFSCSGHLVKPVLPLELLQCSSALTLEISFKFSFFGATN